jgi:hypothetical protein
MIVERANNQIIIKVSRNVDTFGFQRIMDYLEYLEITSKTTATQEDADKLADELNENWWAKNRSRKKPSGFPIANFTNKINLCDIGGDSIKETENLYND